MSEAAPRASSRAAWLLSAGMLVASASLYAGPVRGLPPLRSGVALSPVLIAGLTLLLSASAITLQFRRQGHTLSMTEIPLAIGLFATAPGPLVLAKVAGHIADGARRRVPVVKTVFNVALVAFQVPLAVLVFRWVLGNEAPHGPVAWFAAGVAVVVANGISAVAIIAVIGLTQNRFERTGLDIAVGKFLVVSLVETSLAMIAVEVLRAEARTGWLLLVVAGLLLAFTRAYGALRDRHEELGAVYDFGRSVAVPDDPADLPALVAEKTRVLLRAERAEVVLDDDGRLTSWRADDEGVVSARYDAALWPWQDVLSSGAAVAGTRGRDAVAAPLRSESGVFGMLAAYDRMGNVRRFGRVDLELLEALAAQAGASLDSVRLVERLRHEAAHDNLTGLANWSGLRTRVDDAIAHSGPVALLLMDLDRFKDVNDTLGHHNGDVLLVELSRRLTEHRGHGDVVGRLGGDEFAVVLTDGGGAGDATRLARELLALTAQPVVLDGVRIEMAASIGIAVYPEHGLNADALLQRADVAMYEAKAAHTGVAVYQPSEDHVSARRLVLAGELRRAIDEATLWAAYQPKVSLEDGRVTGAEALLRWEHRELGFVSPDEFITLAERTGLIVPLTAYVLDVALRQCAQWAVDGLDIGIAVNVSARNLLDSDLPDEIGALLIRHGVEPRRLTLEVTESSVMADPARALDVLDRLSGIGLRLSVDDFGTGYSSLTYLKRLPVDEVKIDKSFVIRMATDEQDAAIVRSIIDLAGSLGLAVVAEGVEDTASWQLLADLGCDVVQGYALCRPVPAAEVTEWVRGWDASRAVRRTAREVTELAARRRTARGLEP
jgi:diguanylate cyclase (GGDEF)-like protein